MNNNRTQFNRLTLWISLLVMALLGGFTQTNAGADTLMVDSALADQPPGAVVGQGQVVGQTAFATLREAIQASQDGDRVLVWPGTYRGGAVNKSIHIEATGPGVVIQGNSPAVVVNTTNVTIAGLTLVANEANPPFNSPVILVESNSLTMRNCTVIESTNFNQAAIHITGGTADLGAVGDPGGNTIIVNGAGTLVSNLSAGFVTALGNTWQVDHVTLPDGFAIEDKIWHALDNCLLGLVNYMRTNVYVTTNSGSIQCGIDAVPPAGWTVNVGPGVFGNNCQIVINKAVNVLGRGPSLTTINGCGLNLGIPNEGTVRIIASGHVLFEGFKIINPSSDATGTPNRIGVYAQSPVLGVNYLVRGNEIYGSTNALDNEDYGIYGENGLESLSILNNRIRFTGSNPILLERHQGPTEVGYNIFDRGVASVGNSAYFNMNHSGTAITNLQKVHHNVVNMGNDPGLVGAAGPGNAGSAIAFVGAFQGFGVGGYASNTVQITDNLITNLVAHRRGISLDNQGAAAADGDIIGALIQGNRISGNFTPLDPTDPAQSVGIRLVNQISGTRISQNTIDDAYYGIWQYQTSGFAAIRTLISVNNDIGNCFYGTKIDAGTATLKANIATIQNNRYGLYVDGASTRVLVEDCNLSGNTYAGITAINGATVDAGDCQDANVTGLGTGSMPGGSSRGLNYLEGYFFDNAYPMAIENLNTAAQPAVLAQKNYYGVTNAGLDLETIFFDDSDTAGANAPVIASQQPLFVQCPPSLILQCIAAVPPGATDYNTFTNQGGSIASTTNRLIISFVDVPAVYPPEGTVTRTYTINDGCGLPQICTQTFSISATNPPAIICSPNIIVGAPGPVTWTTTAGNVCGPLTVTCNPTNGSTFPPGDTLVTCTVVDAQGRSNSCTFHVIVCTPGLRDLVVVDDNYNSLPFGTPVAWPHQSALTNYNIGCNAFPTIQQAVAGVNPNGTILVASGSYTPTVVTQAVRILAPQAGVCGTSTSRPAAQEARVTGGGIGFDVQANNVTIDGFIIEQNTLGAGFGVQVGAVQGLRLINNLIQSNLVGVVLLPSPGGVINEISCNLFQENNGAFGGQFGIHAPAGSINNYLIKDNLFNEQVAQPFAAEAGIVIFGVPNSSSGVVISNNTFNVTDYGMFLQGLINSAVLNNQLLRSTAWDTNQLAWGIDLSQSSLTRVQGNNISNLVRGIQGVLDADLTLRDNVFRTVATVVTQDVSVVSPILGIVLFNAAGTNVISTNIIVVSGSVDGLYPTFQSAAGITLDSSLPSAHFWVQGNQIDVNVTGEDYSEVGLQGLFNDPTSHIYARGNRILNGDWGADFNSGQVTMIDNIITGHEFGVRFTGGAGLLEYNDLTANSIAGLLVGDGAVVDAGDCTGPSISGLVTGSGPLFASGGNNNLSGYFGTPSGDNAEPWAITNYNTSVQSIVMAQNNFWGPSSPPLPNLEHAVWDNNDNLALSDVVESQGGQLVLFCPSDITVQCLSLVPPPATTWQAYTNLGGYVSGPAPSGSAVITNFDTFLLTNCQGVVRRTYFLRDVCMLQAACVQEIFVRDTTPPVMFGPFTPDRITNSAPTNQCGLWVGLTNFSVLGRTISDNCLPVPANCSFTTNCNPPLPFFFPVGSTPVTCWVTDLGGNSVTNSFTHVVRDVTMPFWVQCNNQTFTNDNNTCGQKTNVVYSISFWDACDGTNVNIVCNPANGTTFNWGTNNVSCTVSDAAGNSTNCSFTVAVLDRVPPRFLTNCPLPSVEYVLATGQCTTNASLVAPRATNDYCGTVVTATSDPAVLTFGAGTNIVRWIVHDGRGNTNVCQQTVLVRDRTMPLLVGCQPDTNISCSVWPIPTPPPTATDSCTNFVPVSCRDSLPVLVTSSSLEGWLLYYDGNPFTGSDGFSNSPVNLLVGQTTLDPLKNPPLSTLNPTCAGAFRTAMGTNGGSTVELRHAGYNRVRLTDLSELTYWTYVQQQGNGLTQHCYLRLNIDADGNGAGDDELTFEPSDQTTGSVIPAGLAASTNVWQKWNVLAPGGIWRSANNPLITSLAAYIAQYPTAQLMNGDGATNGAVRVGAGGDDGRWKNAVTWADVLTIGTNGVSTTYNFDTGTCTNACSFFVIRTCTATDASGNDASCSQIIRIADTNAPTLVFNNLIVPTDPGRCYAIVDFVRLNFVDNCDPNLPTYTCTPSPNSIFDKGTTPVNCTVADRCGNSTNVSFTVTVEDREKPKLWCPGNLTNATTATTCVGQVSWTVTASDNCDTLIQCTTNGVLAGSRSSTNTNSLTLTMNLFKGVYTVVCGVIDTAGNNTNCQFLVVVEDRTPPQFAFCPGDMIVRTHPGQCGTNVNFTPVLLYPPPPQNPNTTNCGDDLIVCIPPSGTEFTNGVTWVNCYGFDTSGNTNLCRFSITVLDEEPPVLFCSSNLVVKAESNRCDAVVTYHVDARDNCTNALVTYSCTPTNGAVFPVGTNLVTCTARDGAGNSNSCTFTITVRDEQLPTPLCPTNDVVVVIPIGKCEARATWTYSGVDNCAILTNWCWPTNNHTFPLGTNLVTCYSADLSGNVSNCVFRVVIVDNEAPLVACQSNIVVNTAPGACAATVTYALATATDNCSTNPGSITIACYPTNGASFPKGTTTVTCYASDESRNTNTCTFTVTVNDLEAPIAYCRGNLTNTTIAGTCSVPVTWSMGSCFTNLSFCTTNHVYVTDNCPGSTITCEPPPGTVFSVGTYTVWCTGRDQVGNTNRCSFLIVVRDEQLPTITCSTNIVVNNDPNNPTNKCGAFVTYVAPTVADNCPGVTNVGCVPPSGSFFPVGTNLVNCSVVDASGNIVYCGFEIVVRDTIKPGIVCPPDLLNYLVDPDKCLATEVALGTPTLSDNCGTTGLVVTNNAPVDPILGTNFTPGLHQVIWGVVDTNGNWSTCTQLVQVIEGIPPVITNCPPPVVYVACNIDLSVPASTNATGWPTGLWDNCLSNCSTLTLTHRDAFPVQITSNSLNGWAIVTGTVGLGGAPYSGSTFFTVGPTNRSPFTFMTNPPICSGSFCTDIGSNGQSVVEIRHGGYDGTRLGDLSELRYWTFQDVSGPNPNTNRAHYIALNIDMRGDGTLFDVLYFFPEDQTNAVPSQGPVTNKVWQQWNARAGLWTAYSGSIVEQPLVDYMALWPLAKIVNSAVSGPGIRLVAGGEDFVWRNFRGYVDAVTIGVNGVSTTYDFDVGPCPSDCIHLTIRTWTLTDCAGNDTSCSQWVYSVDTNAPTFAIFGQTLTFTNDLSLCSALVDFRPWLGLTDSTNYCDPNAVTYPPSGVRQWLCTNALGDDVSLGTNYAVGSHPIFCVAWDRCRNTNANCTFIIDVLDKEPPTPVCSNVVVSTLLNACETNVNWIALGGVRALDNCNGPIVMECRTNGVVLPNPATFAKGVHNVSCTFADDKGNVNTCAFSVTVNDTQNPTLVFPTEYLTNAVNLLDGRCYQSVNPSNIAWNIALAMGDNCPGWRILCTPTNNGSSGFTNFSVGSRTVTCTNVDASGNRTVASFNIRVIDVTRPDAGCPGLIVTNAVAGGCSSVVLWSNRPADNCPGTVVTCMPPSGSVFYVGTSNVTCTATDASGNVNFCTFQVVVRDTQGPAISCPTFSLALSNDPGTCARVVTWTNTIADNCGAVLTNWCVPAIGSAFPVGVTTVTCFAVDVGNNTNTCSFTVRVWDFEAPEANCPANIVVAADTNSCAKTNVTWIFIATDNCNLVTNYCQPSSGSTFNVGVTTVTCTSVDASNYFDRCTFTVTVEDRQAPVIACPTREVVECGFSITPVRGGFPSYAGTAYENCRMVDTNWVDLAPIEITPSQLFTTPQLTGWSFFTEVATGTGAMSNGPAAPPLGTGSAAMTINGTGRQILYTYEYNGQRLDQFTELKYWTYQTGSGGNAATLQFNIDYDVTDTNLAWQGRLVFEPSIAGVGPVVDGVWQEWNALNGRWWMTGNAIVGGVNVGQPYPIGTPGTWEQILTAFPNAAIWPNTSTATNGALFLKAGGPWPATTYHVDALTIGITNDVNKSKTYNFDLEPGDTCAERDLARFWTITDASGNIDTCTQIVSVRDSLAPNIFCPSQPITLNSEPNVCGAHVTFATSANDICCGTNVSLICTPTNGTLFPVGPVTVTCVATDSSGNYEACYFVVTVIDVQPPVITNCPPNLMDVPVNHRGAGLCSRQDACYATNVVLGNLGFTDNCPGSIVTSNWVAANGSIIPWCVYPGQNYPTFPAGTNIVVWTVTDPSGLKATCTQLVVVRDSTPPVLVNCPMVMTNIECSMYATNSVNWIGNPFAIDDCCLFTPNPTPYYDHFPVQVTSTNLDGWTLFFSGTNFSGSDGFTVGPRTPPICTGSWRAAMGNNGFSLVEIRHGGYDGLPLEEVTELRYWTYQVTDGVGRDKQCYIALNIDTDGNGTGDDVIYFEPEFSHLNGFVTDQGAVTNGGWQHWDALHGAWWSLNHPAVLNIQPLSFYLAFFPNARIVNSEVNTGGVRVGAGGADGVWRNFEGHADAVTIGTNGLSTTYDFDVGVCATACKYVKVRTWTASDCAANESSCSTILNIFDTSGPAVTLLGTNVFFGTNLIVANDPSLCSAVVNYQLSVSDYCDPAGTNIVCAPPSGSTFPVGFNTVTCRAWDSCENTNLWTFRVIVEDKEAPEPVCPADLVVSTTGTNCFQWVTFGPRVLQDNCVGTNVHWACTNEAGLNAVGAMYPKGTNKVTCWASDDSYNTNVCSFNIIVRDIMPPIIVVATNGVSVLPNGINVVADSNFCSAIVTYFTNAWDMQTNCCSQALCAAPFCATNQFLADRNLAWFRCSQPSGTRFPVGTTTVLCEAVDCSGNTNLVSFPVTVRDTEAPLIGNLGTAFQCSLITTNIDTNECSRLVRYNPFAVDNCQPVTVSCTTNGVPVPDPAVFPKGDTRVECLATDASGNTSTCSFIVRVTDNRKPTLIVPADILTNTVPGLCYWPSNLAGFATGGDFCPGSQVKCYAGGVTNAIYNFPVGTNIVNCYTEDSSGNRTNASFLVVVKDLELPSQPCPTTLPIVVNTAPGVCSNIVTWTLPTPTDNCRVALTECGPTNGSYFLKGVTSVTCTNWDTNFNFSVCTFVVTVQDREGPVLVLADIVEETNAPGLCEKQVFYATIQTRDNCDGPNTATVVCNPPSGTVYPVGTITNVTCTGTDSSGNSTTKSFTIFVRDGEKPALTVPASPYVVATDPNRCDRQNVTWTTSATDNCPGAVSIECTPSSGSYFTNSHPSGRTTNTITCVATDVSGNKQTNSFQLVLADLQAPVMTCPPQVVYVLTTNLQCEAAVNYTNPPAYDNCFPPQTNMNARVSCTPTNGSVFPIGTNVVTCIVDDDRGNTNTCQFNLVVVDLIDPTISCPPDTNLACTIFLHPTNTGGYASAWDNCGVLSTNWVVNEVTIVTSNSLDGWQLVEVGTNLIQSTARFVNGPATPPLGTGSLQLLIGSNANGIAEGRVSGYAGQRLADLSELSYWAYRTQDGSGGNQSIYLALDIDLDNDGLADDTLVFEPRHQNGVNGTPNQLPLTTGVWKEWNALLGAWTSLNRPLAATLQPLSVYVGTFPNATIANDVNGLGGVRLVAGGIGPWDGFDGAVDEFIVGFSGLSKIYSFEAEPVLNVCLKVQYLTWTATDKGGNKTSCSQKITRVDNDSPIFTSCSPVVLSNVCSAVVNYTVAATDNCSAVTITCNPTNGTTFLPGTTTVTCTANDACGHSAQCIFSVTLIDTEPPFIVSCAPVQTVPAGANCQGALPDLTHLVVASDNCDTNLTVTQLPLPGTLRGLGTNLVMLTVTDDAGNSTPCTTTVVVHDLTPPTITACAASIVLQADTNCQAVLPALTGLAATDNCSTNLTVTQSPPAGTVISVGSNGVTMTVTDAAGNSATCVAVVTVQGAGSGAPVIQFVTAQQTQPYVGLNDVLDCATNVVQGAGSNAVVLCVTVTNECGTLAGPPTVGLTNGVNGATATFFASAGNTYCYFWDVTAGTANGTWTITITAVNQSGSSKSDATHTLCVNTRQVTGSVQLEGFTGNSRTVTFVASAGLNAPALKTWNLPLNNWAAPAAPNAGDGGKVATYVLADVPAGTTHISAKTGWNLREKLPAVFDANNQAITDFLSDAVNGWTDATDHFLRGGDLDADNLVYTLDYGILGAGWTNPPGPLTDNADITGDGVVNFFDFNPMSLNWGAVGDPR